MTIRWDEALSWEPTAGLPDPTETQEEAPPPPDEEGAKDDDTWGEVEAEPSLTFDSVTGEWVLPPDDAAAAEVPAMVVVDPGPDPTGLLGTLMELPYPVIMQVLQFMDAGSMMLVLFRCMESYEPPIHLAMTLELLEPTLKVSVVQGVYCQASVDLICLLASPARVYTLHALITSSSELPPSPAASCCLPLSPHVYTPSKFIPQPPSHCPEMMFLALPIQSLLKSLLNP